jgi:predicted GIY-YIG superfamily endonuclease
MSITTDEQPLTGFGNMWFGLINRFHLHNELSRKDRTRNFKPWVVIYCEYFEDKRQAGKREKELKVEKAENGFGIK